jgi:hypothetical protein
MSPCLTGGDRRRVGKLPAMDGLLANLGSSTVLLLEITRSSARVPVLFGLLIVGNADDGRLSNGKCSAWVRLAWCRRRLFSWSGQATNVVTARGIQCMRGHCKHAFALCRTSHLAKSCRVSCNLVLDCKRMLQGGRRLLMQFSFHAQHTRGRLAGACDLSQTATYHTIRLEWRCAVAVTIFLQHRSGCTCAG